MHSSAYERKFHNSLSCLHRLDPASNVMPSGGRSNQMTSVATIADNPADLKQKQFVTLPRKLALSSMRDTRISDEPKTSLANSCKLPVDSCNQQLKIHNSLVRPTNQCQENKTISSSVYNTHCAIVDDPDVFQNVMTTPTYSPLSYTTPLVRLKEKQLSHSPTSNAYLVPETNSSVGCEIFFSPPPMFSNTPPAEYKISLKSSELEKGNGMSRDA